jgi:hypothetical protein
MTLDTAAVTVQVTAISAGDTFIAFSVRAVQHQSGAPLAIGAVSWQALRHGTSEVMRVGDVSLPPHAAADSVDICVDDLPPQTTVDVLVTATVRIEMPRNMSVRTRWVRVDGAFHNARTLPPAAIVRCLSKSSTGVEVSVALVPGPSATYSRTPHSAIRAAPWAPELDIVDAVSGSSVKRLNVSEDLEGNIDDNRVLTATELPSGTILAVRTRPVFQHPTEEGAIIYGLWGSTLLVRVLDSFTAVLKAEDPTAAHIMVRHPAYAAVLAELGAKKRVPVAVATLQAWVARQDLEAVESRVRPPSLLSRFAGCEWASVALAAHSTPILRARVEPLQQTSRHRSFASTARSSVPGGGSSSRGASPSPTPRHLKVGSVDASPNALATISAAFAAEQVSAARQVSFHLPTDARYPSGIDDFARTATSAPSDEETDSMSSASDDDDLVGSDPSAPSAARRDAKGRRCTPIMNVGELTLIPNLRPDTQYVLYVEAVTTFASGAEIVDVIDEIPFRTVSLLVHKSRGKRQAYSTATRSARFDTTMATMRTMREWAPYDPDTVLDDEERERAEREMRYALLRLPNVLCTGASFKYVDASSVTVAWDPDQLEVGHLVGTNPMARRGVFHVCVVTMPSGVAAGSIDGSVEKWMNEVKKLASAAFTDAEIFDICDRKRRALKRTGVLWKSDTQTVALTADGPAIDVTHFLLVTMEPAFVVPELVGDRRQWTFVRASRIRLSQLAKPRLGALTPLANELRQLVIAGDVRLWHRWAPPMSALTLREATLQLRGYVNGCLWLSLGRGTAAAERDAFAAMDDHQLNSVARYIALQGVSETLMLPLDHAWQDFQTEALFEIANIDDESAWREVTVSRQILPAPFGAHGRTLARDEARMVHGGPDGTELNEYIYVIDDIFLHARYTIRPRVSLLESDMFGPFGPWLRFSTGDGQVVSVDFAHAESTLTCKFDVPPPIRAAAASLGKTISGGSASDARGGITLAAAVSPTVLPAAAGTCPNFSMSSRLDQTLQSTASFAFAAVDAVTAAVGFITLTDLHSGATVRIDLEPHHIAEQTISFDNLLPSRYEALVCLCIPAKPSAAAAITVGPVDNDTFEVSTIHRRVGNKARFTVMPLLHVNALTIGTNFVVASAFWTRNRYTEGLRGAARSAAADGCVLAPADAHGLTAEAIRKHADRLSNTPSEPLVAGPRLPPPSLPPDAHLVPSHHTTGVDSSRGKAQWTTFSR